MSSIDPVAVTDIQYQMLAQRRQNYDNLIWQTPTISLTGQAFLFTIAFGNGSIVGRLVASILALLASLASEQLLSKHRHFEIYYAELLQSIERAKQYAPIHERPPRGTGVAAWSSYLVWRSVLLAFGAAAITAVVLAVLNAIPPN